MSERDRRSWLNLRRTAGIAAGCALMALMSLSTTARAAPPRPADVFTATTSTLTTQDGGNPGAVAIGDLHSTSAAQGRLNAFLCRPFPDARALPGCRNDVASVNIATSSVSVWPRDLRDGGLGPPIPIIPTGVTPDSIGIGDFNGDGSNDIAVGNLSDGSVSLFYATPGGSNAFEPVNTIPINFTDQAYVTSIAVGDLGNGHADIAVTVSGQDNATLSEPGELVLLMNDGHGNFTQTALPTGSIPKDVVIGNLGNGRPDLAVANQGTGNGVFDPGVELFMSNGRGGYTTQTLSTAAGFEEPQSVAIGDFNGDGRPDLVTANLGSVPGTVTIFTNQGHGNYAQTTLPAGSGPSSVAAGDLNGDGVDDFAITNEGDNDMTVFMAHRGKSAPSFTDTTLPTGSTPTQLAIGHLNSRDGANDIAVANSFADDVTVFTNTTG